MPNNCVINLIEKIEPVSNIDANFKLSLFKPKIILMNHRQIIARLNKTRNSNLRISDIGMSLLDEHMVPKILKLHCLFIQVLYVM